MARQRSSTTTLRGADANNFMASAAAQHCLDEEEAKKLVEKAGEGPYGTALRRSLRAHGFLREETKAASEGQPASPQPAVDQNHQK